MIMRWRFSGKANAWDLESLMYQNVKLIKSGAFYNVSYNCLRASWQLIGQGKTLKIPWRNRREMSWADMTLNWTEICFP